jgi:hypothetical protein
MWDRTMKLAAVSAGGMSSLMSSVLNPNFKGIPDAKALAKYLINAMITIKKNDLPIRIYISQDVSNKIGNLLAALGVKFRTIPADKMQPPYIFLTTEDNYLVIKTVDSNGKEIASYKTPFPKFIEAFEEFFTRYKERRTQRKEKEALPPVDEVIVSSESLKKFMEKYRELFGEDL